MKIASRQAATCRGPMGKRESNRCLILSCVLQDR